jgi:hypothetical protein
MSATLTLTFEDFTGQRIRASEIPPDSLVNDVLQEVTGDLCLRDIDDDGRPVAYHATTDDGVVLNPSDRIGDLVRDEQIVNLTKTVTAGSGGR